METATFKTGGWPMTVGDVIGGDAECVWFEPMRSANPAAPVSWSGPYRSRFPEGALVACEQPKFD